MSVGIIEGEGSKRLTNTGSDPGVYVTVLVYLEKTYMPSSVNGRESNALCEWSDAHDTFLHSPTRVQW